MGRPFYSPQGVVHRPVSFRVRRGRSSGNARLLPCRPQPNRAPVRLGRLCLPLSDCRASGICNSRAADPPERRTLGGSDARWLHRRLMCAPYAGNTYEPIEAGSRQEAAARCDTVGSAGPGHICGGRLVAACTGSSSGVCREGRDWPRGTRERGCVGSPCTGDVRGTHEAPRSVARDSTAAVSSRPTEPLAGRDPRAGDGAA